MTIRARLLLLSFLMGVSIVTVMVLFSSVLSSMQEIDRESSRLVVLADSIRDLSIAVNSLDSSQFDGVAQKLTEAEKRSEAAFADVAGVSVLPQINADLKDAFEVIGNMHGLITEDLKSLDGQFRSFQSDLVTAFFESRSTTLRMFSTDDRFRASSAHEALFTRLEDLITAINGMTETLSAVSDTVRDQTAVIHDETEKLRTTSLVTSVSLSGIVLFVIVGISLFMGTSISRRVKALQTGLAPVGQGDFSRHLEVRGSDEIAHMARTINELMDSLNRLLREVQGQVNHLDSLGVDLKERMRASDRAVAEIEGLLDSSEGELNAQNRAVAGSQESARLLGEAAARLAADVQAQKDILSSSSSGIEQIIANIGSVTANTAKAENASGVLREVAREGQRKLDLVARSVDEIGRSSDNLVQVTVLIHDIAAQTNLLAMNASIEAAHAGTAGRGFGVVASEIRKLAEQAASQAQQISQDLGGINGNIDAIRDATGAAVAVFHKVVAQTEQVGTIVQEVQTSMAEQDRGGALVLDGLRQLGDISGHVDRALRDLERGEATIQERVSDLAAQNALVNDNNQAVHRKTREIGTLVTATAGLAVTTGDQIEALKNETGRFRTSL